MHLPCSEPNSRSVFRAGASLINQSTVTSMRLTDLASIFTAKIWAIIKALEEILLHPNVRIYETETSHDWDGDTKVRR